MFKVKTKVHIAITVFVLAFALGTTFVFLTFQNSLSLTKTTSLCVAIKDNSSQLASGSKTSIYLKGYLSAKNDFLSFSDSDQNGCDNNYADILLTDKGNLSLETQNILQEMSHLTDENNLARVEVEIVGTLEEQTLQGFLSSHFLIKAIQIKPKSSIQMISHSALTKERKSR